ncbi:DUF2505 domain-containing protein [Nocardioides sp. LHG3406-4]|uniref:DUF2505 domain-containing protein n=1 Tax=Nocardioides sp. LHG3406-4 TaxID=2804575 RepID=UPI003CE762C7
MTTRLTHLLTYDAPLAAVAAMLADPAFREAVCDAQRVLRRSVTVEPAGEGKRVRIDQVQAATGLPSFATRLVGDEIEIVQQEDWSTADQASMTIAIPGKPGDIAGTIRLAEAGGVTTQTVDMTIKVGVPLVGGKMEGFVSDLLLKALKAENRVGRDYLS